MIQIPSHFRNGFLISTTHKCPDSSFGILYIATGDRHYSEACHNAQITAFNSPGIPISLLTDRFRPLPNGTFDEIHILPNCSFGYRDKILGLSFFKKYDTTLFMDSDAFAIRPLNDIKSITVSFDLGACPAPVSHPPGWHDSSVPSYFPEYNTGILIYKSSSYVNKLFAGWLDLYDYLFSKFSQTWDQASFRSLLWAYMCSHKIRFLHLPSEYNLRTTKPWTVSRGSYVSILHGRFDQSELSSFMEFLNTDNESFRTWAHWLKDNPHSSICPAYDNTFYKFF